MKKKIVVLALMALCVFGACGKKEKKDDNNKEVSVSMERLEYSDKYYIKSIDVTDGNAVKSELAVSDDEVDAAVEKEVSSLANVVSSNHDIAEEGDVVTISYVGTIDGVPFDGGTGTNSDVTLGAGMFVPGFEEGIIGMKVGETKDVPITFPNDYYEDLAGKEAVFAITLESIDGTSEKVELTDELIANNYGQYGFTTVERFKDYFRRELFSDKISALVDKCEIYSVDTDEKDVYDEDVYKLNVDAFMAYYKEATGTETTYDNVVSQYNDNMIAITKNCMVYEAWAKALGITVTESDFAEYCKENGFSSVEEACNESWMTRESLYYEVLNNLVSERLYSMAK